MPTTNNGEPGNLPLREYIDVQVDRIRVEFREIRDYKDQKLLELRDKYEAERDRRYAEVKAEQEKAERVREAAKRDAMVLAREIQTYKDEKANELREQINKERNLYATKLDLTASMDKVVEMIKPLNAFVSQTRGTSVAYGSSWAILVAVLSLLIAGASVILVVTR